MNKLEGRLCINIGKICISLLSLSLLLSLCSGSLLFATCELRWDFPEEERMMQYSRDKYFPQLRTKVINPVGEPHNTLLGVPTHKITNPCTEHEQGVVNPSVVMCKIKLYRV